MISIFFPKKKKRRMKDDVDKDKVIFTHSLTGTIGRGLHIMFP